MDFIFTVISLLTLLARPISHRSHMANGFRVPSTFIFAALSHIAPSYEYLKHYSFGFGVLPSFYVAWWRIIRNKFAVPISPGTSRTSQCCARKKHVFRGSISCAIAIWQHWLWRFGMITAVMTVYMMSHHQISALTVTASLNGTEWHRCNGG